MFLSTLLFMYKISNLCLFASKNMYIGKTGIVCIFTHTKK